MFVTSADHAEVAVLIVAYNSAGYLPALIENLRAIADSRRIRVVVVDNESVDDTVETVRRHPDITLVVSGGNVGYAGGINAGLAHLEPCDTVLILNPDLRIAPDAVDRMLAAVTEPGVGAVVPLMRDEDGSVYPSLRHEPSIRRALGDALFGRRVSRIAPRFSEIDDRPDSYRTTHEVDWATGAALLMPIEVSREIGDWNEEFFLYSEETDYFRRIRERGYRVVFEPAAVVHHRRGGSGASPALLALMAVNRVRYVERHRGPLYAGAFRAVVALAALLRSYDPTNRQILAAVVSRERWQELPAASSQAVPATHAMKGSGAVIVPAYNEGAVIERTLRPLSGLAQTGIIELIVVPNGCHDDTAARARAIDGVTVVELREGSKIAALNAGDAMATCWPRLYLDADIQLSPRAILDVLDVLRSGEVLAARPEFRYDTTGAAWLVRSYYRARQRVPLLRKSMWGAGVYGLSADGHARFGEFPSVIGDDLFVEVQFQPDEKTIVDTDRALVKTPTDARSLLAILRRVQRAGREQSDQNHPHSTYSSTGAQTATAVARTIRGPLSLVDAAVYLSFALMSRRKPKTVPAWERDESSRAAS